MTVRSWQDNADEFGILTKQGVDVRLGVLVACSVEVGAGQGLRTDRYEDKVSASKFSEHALNTSNPNRVKRHLDAWNKCAAEGWCDASSELTPGDASRGDLKVPTAEQFALKFDASKSGGRPRASAEEVAKGLERPDYLEAVVKNLTPEVLHKIHEATTVTPIVDDFERQRRRQVKENEARQSENKDQSDDLASQAAIRAWISQWQVRAKNGDEKAKGMLRAHIDFVRTIEMEMFEALS